MDKFNIVIGTHGRFGEELVKSAEMIAGEMSNVTCCSLLPIYSFEEYMHLVDEVLSHKEGYTIVLVDLFGGTPSNVFTVLSRKYKYNVVTGVNLPMLIDLYLKLSNCEKIDEESIIDDIIKVVKESCVHTNKELESK